MENHEQPLAYVGPGIPAELIAEEWLVEWMVGMHRSLGRIADALEVVAGKAKLEAIYDYEQAKEDRHYWQQSIERTPASRPECTVALQNATRKVAILEEAHPWLKEQTER